MKKTMLLVGAAFLISLFLFSMTEVAPAAGEDEVRIGALVPYTGLAATVGPEIDRGIQFVLDEAGWKVSGKKVKLIKEDEGDDPAMAVAKAKKLVEQDKVHVVLGPLLAHTGSATAAYLGQLGVPHFPSGMSESPKSSNAFFTAGTGRGNAYPTGLYAYDELGTRTAGLLNMDYSMGHQTRDGFVAGFTARGGKIVTNQLIPMGTADMAPYIEGIGNVDIVAIFLVNPTDFAFVRQYREFGLKMPVLMVSCQPQEEALLTQMGDNVVGMYGSTMYGPLIDTSANKDFVKNFKDKFGVYPGIATMHAGYWTTAMYLEAVKATKGDTSHAKIIDALKGIKDMETPAGLLSMNENRMGIHDVYIFKAAKMGDRYAWEVVKTYLKVQPQY